MVQKVWQNVGQFSIGERLRTYREQGARVLYQDVTGGLIVWQTSDGGGWLILYDDSTGAISEKWMLSYTDSVRMLRKWLDETFYPGLSKIVMSGTHIPPGALIK